jgi:long-chain fatty acid transport protein
MRNGLVAALGLVLSLGATRLDAGGLAMEDQGARAGGMGGAFMAQAADPTAIFYNPGALALLPKKKGLAAGVSLSSIRQSSFQGVSPGIGAGTTGEQKSERLTLPYAFATAPLGARAVSGLGAYTPYRLHNEWSAPNTFSGRYLATSSDIETLDLAPTVGFQLTPTIGIGAGAIYRRSTLSASRRIGATLSGSIADIAVADLETDSTSSTGWHAGLLWRPGDAFSFGVTHRSKMSVDFDGAGKLTQVLTGDAQFDQLVAASLPFGQELALTSHFDYPARTAAGIAVSLSKAVMFEIDAERTTWKNTRSIPFLFPNNSGLDTTYALNLKDTTSFRGGVRFQFPTGPQLRFGYAIDKSPQPDATVGPFIADAGRKTATAGLGLDWLDVSVGWTTFEQRSITTNADQFNGNYRGNAWTAAITVTK